MALDEKMVDINNSKVEAITHQLYCSNNLSHNECNHIKRLIDNVCKYVLYIMFFNIISYIYIVK